MSKRLGASEQDLFGNLADDDRSILACGFGSKVHECWDQAVAAALNVAHELRIRGRGDLERGIGLIRKEV